MTTFNFKAFGNRTTEPTDRQAYIGFIPMNCRYQSEPVQIGDREIIIDVHAYEYDEYTSIDIYETDENGQCWGNGERMVTAGLWRLPTVDEPQGAGYYVRKDNRPMYRPSDIAEAVQRLYPEVEAVIKFDDIQGKAWGYELH